MGEAPREPQDESEHGTAVDLPPGWQSPDELGVTEVTWAYRVVSSLRAAMGLRPLPPPVRPPEAPAVEEALPALQAQDFMRAGAYIALALAFVGLTVLAVWLYGRSSRPGLEQIVRAQTVLREAARHLNDGDLAGAEALHRQLAGRRTVGRMLVFFEGTLEAAYRRAGKQMPQPSARMRDDPAEALAREAGRLDAAGDKPGAVRAVGMALEKAPDDLSLRLIQAGLLAVTGDYQGSLTQAEEIERRTGPNGTVHGLKAQAYLGMERYAEAQDEFGRALVYEPSSTSLRLGLVEVLTRTRQLARASAETLQVLRYDESSPEGYLALGLINEVGDDLVSAENCYRQAIRLSPDHVKALNNLAFLLADKLNRPAEALPLAQKAVSLAPESAVFQDTLGWVYHRLGKDQEARAVLKKAHGLDPSYKDAQEHLRQLEGLAAGARKVAN